MAARPLAIQRTGLLTAVGGNAPASCAAFRAKVNNPTPTRFMNGCGDWILAHAVDLPPEFRGLDRLKAMAHQVMTEVLQGLDQAAREAMPLLLCVAERERPGRCQGLDEALLDQLQQTMGCRFATDTCVIPQGRVAVAVALAMARKILDADRAQQVLIVAVDSLLEWSTLSHFDRVRRLLTEDNSNGFMAGEGAGALIVGHPGPGARLLCTGMGFAVEKAHIDSEEPLRADGLSTAIREAVADAALGVVDFDYRITDLSGEQYYFKEAALALQRTLHQPKPEFDIWHPAECTGEAGALAGAAIIALADAAARKGFAKGPNVIAHMANDAGPRAALALQFRSA